MFQGAIVDDEIDVLDFLQNSLIKEFMGNNTNIVIDKFSNGENLIEMLNLNYHYDFIFLDIEMKNIDGIELCRKIREKTSNCLVVFISNKDELVFQTFEVQPFRFIRKSHFKEQLSTLVKDLLVEYSSKNKRIIRITEAISKDIFSFDVSKILYIESHNKQCLIVTEFNSTQITIKLSDLENQLTEFGFIKPHRSYLINCKYIFYIGKTSIKLENGIEIPLSRNNINDVKYQYLEYLKK